MRFAAVKHYYGGMKKPSRAAHGWLILALTVSGCASVSRGELAVVAVSTGDIVTTEALLARGGYAEANPLMQEQAVRLVAKAAATAGVIYLHRKFKKKGEHGKAKAVIIIAVSIWGGAFVWNAHHLKESP